MERLKEKIKERSKKKGWAQEALAREIGAVPQGNEGCEGSNCQEWLESNEDGWPATISQRR